MEQQGRFRQTACCRALVKQCAPVLRFLHALADRVACHRHQSSLQHCQLELALMPAPARLVLLALQRVAAVHMAVVLTFFLQGLFFFGVLTDKFFFKYFA